MKTESKAAKVDTPLGPLYVAVRRAREDSWHEMNKGNVTALRPRLLVATDPTFDGHDGDGGWTIRGRRYTVQRVFWFEDRTHIEYGDGRFGDKWYRDNQDWSGDGYRDDRNGQVKFDSATWNAIDRAVIDALDAFADKHPEWAGLSEYLFHDAAAGSAVFKAKQLRAEASKLDAEAAKADTAALAALADVPGRLRNLINS